LLSGDYEHLPPISGPWGSIFGYARQTDPSHASRVPGHPRLQPAFLPQPTSPRHCSLAVTSTSHRCRALRARISVTCQTGPSRAFSGSRPPTPSTRFSPTAYKPPPSLSSGYEHLPPISSLTGSNFGYAPNRPLSCVLGFQAPHTLKPPLSRSLQHPTTALWWLRAHPTDVEPDRLDILFCAPNPPTLRIRTSSPPRPSTTPFPIARDPSLSFSSVSLHVLPISSSRGSVFNGRLPFFYSFFILIFY
jgi:hypothetical protein